MSVIRIDIASEFKDKGFKQASRATNTLDKQLKTLAKTLGTTLSVREIYQFGKASVKAFSDDQKAAFRLTQTLNNLGLAFEDTRVTQFISDLEQASGVLDDSLRPAMQSLLMTTGSVTKSQELLNLALEMSRATGADVASVSQDLARAYVGQTRGLTKYNIGLSRTELQTKSFAELQALLTKQFTGQSAAYLETYAGKVGVLNVAFANMQETIGEGLVDAFMILAGDSGIGGGVTALEIFGQKVADTTRGIAALTRGFSSLRSYMSTVFDLFRNVDPFAPLTAITELGKKNKPLFFPGSGNPMAQEQARKKAEAAAIKRQKELMALQKKSATEAAKRAREQAKREREAQQLKRAGTVFDMEAIQLVAALQNRVTEENRLRLTALLAIYSENAEAADKLTQAVLMLQKPALETLGITLKTGDTATDVIAKIINAQTKLFLLNTGIATIPKAKNPFEDWDSILDRLLGKIEAIKKAVSGFGNTTANPNANPITPPNPNNPNVPPNPNNPVVVMPPPVSIVGEPTPANPAAVALSIGGNVANPFETFTVNGATIIANSGTVMTGQATDTPNEAAARQRIADIFSTIGTFGAGGFQPANVTVNVAGNVMSDQDLVNVITEGLYEVQKRGQSITLNAVAL
jgi:hypothetical protein